MKEYIFNSSKCKRPWTSQHWFTLLMWLGFAKKLQNFFCSPPQPDQILDPLHCPYVVKRHYGLQIYMAKDICSRKTEMCNISRWIFQIQLTLHKGPP